MQSLKLVKPDATYLMIEQYRDIDRQLKVLEAQKKELNDQLKDGYFATNEKFELNGRLLMVCNEITRTMVDSKRLQEEQPLVYGQYSKSTTYKSLLLK
jgi:predicted phage-related endonuclease